MHFPHTINTPRLLCLLQSFLSLPRNRPCRSLMLFKSLVKAALVATALAQPVQHQHHQHAKKDVVTHTVVVTAGGAATTEAATVAASTAAAVSAASAASSAASAASSAASSSSASFSAAAKGITYSPYASDGSCKSAADVKSDLAQLADYLLIRIYGVDCSQVENVLAGLADGQKLFVGIYYVDAIASAVSTIASAVELYGWDVIDTVSVGNELVNSGSATVSQVKSYVEEARTALTSAGYTGKVVSVDTFVAVINNPDLCTISDYVAVNAHPYFDGGVTAEEAGAWVLSQIQRVSAACSGADVFITETGWPTKGNTYGKAVPSSANQAIVLAGISENCGDDVTFFTAFNDLWKSPGDYGVEQYWGIYSD